MQKMGPHTMWWLSDQPWSTPAWAIDDLDTNCGEKKSSQGLSTTNSYTDGWNTTEVAWLYPKGIQNHADLCKFQTLWVKGSQFINDFYVPSST